VRLVLALLLVYVLGLIQVAAGPFFPHLALAAVIIMSWGQDADSSPAHRLGATLLGAFAGLVLDLSSPGAVGPGLLVLALSGYAAASLKLVIYRGRWAATLVCLAALLLWWLLSTLGSDVSPNLVPRAVSSAITLSVTHLGTRFHVAAR
jgi:cell shape-determining protein MreD